MLKLFALGLSEALFYPKWNRRGLLPPPRQLATPTLPLTTRGLSIPIVEFTGYKHVTSLQSNHFGVAGSDGVGFPFDRSLNDKPAVASLGKSQNTRGESAQLMPSMHTDMSIEAERLQADGARRQTPARPEMPHVREVNDFGRVNQLSVAS